MSYNDSITVAAGADLRTLQYRTLAIGGTLCAVNTGRGILQDKPNNGENCNIVYQGRSKYQAGGGTIAVGAMLSCAASGYMITATSGMKVVGFNENSAVVSGGIGHGVFNFIAGNGGNV